MSPSPRSDVMFGDGGGGWQGALEGICVCVCVFELSSRGKEEEGDPICLFCPPDVSESRLKDLALGGGRRVLNSPLSTCIG